MTLNVMAIFFFFFCLTDIFFFHDLHQKLEGDWFSSLTWGNLIGEVPLYVFSVTVERQRSL